MSKAFTRESDDAPEEPIALRTAAALPPGAKNYLTASGASDLREEYARLEQERLRLSQSGGSRMGAIEQRIGEVQQILATAEVVTPPPGPPEQVTFAATVRIRKDGGEMLTVRIVGADEADPDRNWVSWFSPLARALIGVRIGDKVRFRSPSGEQRLEIVGIEYE